MVRVQLLRTNKRGRTARCGAAAMEAVLAAGIALPTAVFLLFMGYRICRYMYQAIAHLLGWPYL